MTHALILDCSLPGIALGLAQAEQGVCDFTEVLLPREGSSTHLAPLAQTLMAKSKLNFADLGGVVIGTGPGSFTGIRMGLAFAYGLKAAFPKLRLVGVSSMDVMAKGKRGGQSTWVLAGTKAQGFMVEHQGSSAPVKAQSFFVNDFPKRFGGTFRRWMLCGAWPEFENLLQVPDSEVSSKAGNNENVLTRMVDRELLYYSLECLASEAKCTDWSGSPAALPVPQYLRASSAEENLAKARI